ncbi:hypothetical protein KAT36_00810 [Candidatus Pacearchaeota archaeon]|nr:hypothetical protein [Candidatus Pacearchaeota archaeon]
MVTTITDVLNIWNEIGVFSYVIPFLLIFAVVFAILKKTGILGDENDGILAIIAVALGLLSLQFDFVSEFFAVIFPRFGIGLSIFLVLIILAGFFFPKATGEKVPGGWIGMAVGIGVVLWALSSWDRWTSSIGFGGWFTENFWALIVLGIIIAVIVIVTKK